MDVPKWYLWYIARGWGMSPGQLEKIDPNTLQWMILFELASRDDPSASI